MISTLKADRGRKYAIKVSKKLPINQTARDKMLCEVRQNEILSSISHSNIVKFYKAWIEEVVF